MQIRKIVSQQYLYFLLLGVICLFGLVIVPTYAKFTSRYSTTDDIVGLSLSFDVKISNLEEYEEIKVDANSYQIFNVELHNNIGVRAYYGVWYKMVSPKEISDDMIIARLQSNEIPTSGDIDINEHKTVSIIIKNNSSESVRIHIGVAFSDTSVDTIEYLAGKKLISGSMEEADYYYDEATSKYISFQDSTIQFTPSTSKYSYTGDVQKFTADHLGVYQLEAWGASGGSMSGTGIDSVGNSRDVITYEGGKGAYTSGIILLDKGTSLYVYVGGEGVSNVSFTPNPSNVNGGYNGGAALNEASQSQFGATGGGATDFRLHSGAWNTMVGLNSRIMVAAGGGGANFRNQGYGEGSGGAGGALHGENGAEALTLGSYFRSDYSLGYVVGTGGTQIGAGYGERHLLDGSVVKEETNLDGSYSLQGGFGYGGFGQSAGGGGYYGGAGALSGGAGGGSSYISGYSGCVAVTSASDSTPKVGCVDGTANVQCSYHYSNNIFKNPQMIDGNTSMPNLAGTDMMVGNKGNGYAKVRSVVPTVDTSKLVVSSGSTIRLSDITCKDNGSGCKISRISPIDTVGLNSGTHDLTIMVSDDYGIVYQYVKKFTVSS